VKNGNDLAVPFRQSLYSKLGTRHALLFAADCPFVYSERFCNRVCARERTRRQGVSARPPLLALTVPPHLLLRAASGGGDRNLDPARGPSDGHVQTGRGPRPSNRQSSGPPHDEELPNRRLDTAGESNNLHATYSALRRDTNSRLST